MDVRVCVCAVCAVCVLCVLCVECHSNMKYGVGISFSLIDDMYLYMVWLCIIINMWRKYDPYDARRKQKLIYAYVTFGRGTFAISYPSIWINLIFEMSPNLNEWFAGIFVLLINRLHNNLRICIINKGMNGIGINC